MWSSICRLCWKSLLNIRGFLNQPIFLLLSKKSFEHRIPSCQVKKKSNFPIEKRQHIEGLTHWNMMNDVYNILMIIGSCVYWQLHWWHQWNRSRHDTASGFHLMDPYSIIESKSDWCIMASQMTIYLSGLMAWTYIDDGNSCWCVISQGSSNHRSYRIKGVVSKWNNVEFNFMKSK